MPNFNDALKILYTLEFSNPSNSLHQNPTESAYTFMGIYEKAHPDWAGWREVHAALIGEKDIKSASVRLYNNERVQRLVEIFYRANFWERMRLSEIDSDLKANEIFLFGVNAGCKVAVKTAQRVVGVTDDGDMGAETIKAVNSYDEDKFDKEYDRLEIQYYHRLIEKNPKFKIYANGWRARAQAV